MCSVGFSVVPSNYLEDTAGRHTLSIEIVEIAIELPLPEGRGFLDYAQRYSAHVSV